jgi:phosphotransferase system IIB component
MKIRLLLLILISFYYQCQAQTSTDEQKDIEQKIKRNWVKYRVEMKDGSQVTNEFIAKKAASMLIFKKGNVCVLISGKTAQQSTYNISSNALVLDRVVSYAIEKLTEHELIFHGVFENIPEEEIIRYHYISTKESSAEYFFRQFIKPTIRIKENLDTAYAFNEYIFPKFKYEAYGNSVILDEFNEVYEQSYNWIEKKFNFPENKKGDFLVSFAVDKFGNLRDVNIKESSDSTYNDDLVKAVGTTRKLWTPAEYDNKKVETIFNYVFKFEEKKDNTQNFDSELYQISKIKAEKQFEKKEYVKAIKLYTKCILMQEEDFDLEPYYKRADSYFALKANKNACLDWSYLSKKGQKKAEKLFFDNCMK